MTAIAATSAAFGDDGEFAPLWPAAAQATDAAVASPAQQAPDHGDPIETIASPWRAPCFYLAFIAGAVLMLAVGVIFAWRAIARRDRSGDTPTAGAGDPGRIAAPTNHR